MLGNFNWKCFYICYNMQGNISPLRRIPLWMVFLKLSIFWYFFHMISPLYDLKDDIIPKNFSESIESIFSNIFDTQSGCDIFSVNSVKRWFCICHIRIRHCSHMWNIKSPMEEFKHIGCPNILQDKSRLTSHLKLWRNLYLLT